MKTVIFGLTISSAWGNGHATLWRGLCRALHRLGHEIVFFERDVPYYASHRDMHGASWCRLVLYDDWDATLTSARAEIADAQVAIVTSYCPDGASASRFVCDSAVPRKVFYDLDSPVTLDRLARGAEVPYVPEEGLGGFDLVLSFAGGATLEELRGRLGARAVAPLYGSVDPEVHRPVAPSGEYRNHLSYLGTYAADRQDTLERLFFDAAARRPDLRFALAGSQYPPDLAWTGNVQYFQHMPPDAHSALFCSSGLTLNITRAPMAAAGYCPSGRLFEAAACGTAIVSDWWTGLDSFFAPGSEILIARDTEGVLDALDMSDAERLRIGRAARDHVLSNHTASVRARELERLLQPSWCGAA